MHHCSLVMGDQVNISGAFYIFLPLPLLTAWDPAWSHPIVYSILFILLYVFNSYYVKVVVYLNYVSVDVTSWMGIQRRCLLFSLSSWSVSGSWWSSSHRCVGLCELHDVHYINTDTQYVPYMQCVMFDCIYIMITLSLGIWVQWVVPAADPWTCPLLSIWKLPWQQSETERGVAVSPTHTHFCRVFVFCVGLFFWSLPHFLTSIGYRDDNSETYSSVLKG